MAPPGSPRSKPRERGHHHHRRERRRSHHDSPRRSRHEASASESGSQALSADTLAKLNLLNQHERSRPGEVTPKKARRKRHYEVTEAKMVVERPRRQHKRKKRRVVSGAMLEEGKSEKLRGLRGGASGYKEDRYEEELGDGKKKKQLCELYSTSFSGSID
jgi:glucan 1,3-beta-glucosidase